MNKYLIAALTFLMLLSASPLLAGNGSSREAAPAYSLTLSASDSILPSPSASFQVAGVYWLPDYLKDNKGRTSACEGGNCNIDPDYDCEQYDMETPGARDMTLYTCEEKYPAGSAGDMCYDNCRCQDKFKYTAANCKDSEGKMVFDRNCEGKYETCKCQPAKNPGTGEECALRCTFDNSCVKTRCKPAVTPGTGEECKERCASNTSVCTKKGCKPAVSVISGYTCTERCASDTSICTKRECVDTTGYQSCECGGSGGSVYSCGSTYYKTCSSCCNSSSPDWCGVHGSCHGDCCSDGSIASCEPVCGGSGCNEPDPEPTPPPSCTHGSHKSCSNGCASTCPCCSQCTSCASAPSQPSGPSQPSQPSQPACNYTTTASSCSSQCKNVGSQSCTKNGTTYYNGCGSSKCTSSQKCENGTCKDPAPAHTHSYTCPSDYQSSSCGSGYTQKGTASKKCSCGATSGTCYKCERNTCRDTCAQWRNSSGCQESPYGYGTCNSLGTGEPCTDMYCYSHYYCCQPG